MSDRQGAEGWGDSGNEERFLNEYGSSFWGDEKVLQLDGGRGCPALWMYLMPWIVYFKMVEMVSTMSCVCSHNQNALSHCVMKEHNPGSVEGLP